MCGKFFMFMQEQKSSTASWQSGPVAETLHSLQNGLNISLAGLTSM